MPLHACIVKQMTKAALEKLPAGGWGQWIAFCGFLELYAAKQDKADPPGLLSGADEGGLDCRKKCYDPLNSPS